MDLELKKQFEKISGSVYMTTPEDFIISIQEFPQPTATFPADDPYNGGTTLMHVAATAANAEAIRYLLGKGLDADAVATNGRTPLLYLAASGGNFRNFQKYNPEAVYEAAIVLLDAGASAIKKDKSDNYSFQLAAKTGNWGFLKAIHERGVRMMRLDKEGNNPLHLALAPLTEQYKFKNNPLYRAAFVPNLKAENFSFFERKSSQYLEFVDFIAKSVESLMEAGVDPEQANESGITPLEVAFRCEAKRVRAIMKGLPDAAKDDKIAATGGYTLQQAVFLRDKEAFEAILAAGYQDINGLEDIVPHPDPRYDWDEMPPYGDGTALGQACLLFYPEMIELLLQHGADTNTKDSLGRTAFTWFFMHNRTLHPDYFINDTPGKIIDMAVKAGMELNAAVTDTGFTLLNFACATWFGDVYPGTEEKGFSQPGNRLLMYDNYLVKDTFRILVIRALLKNGADVNKPNLNSQTPLIFACGGNSGLPLASDISILLLEKGADVAAKDNYGNTPLIYAAFNEDTAVGYDIAQNLFDFGDPEPNATNTDGKKALDYAVARENEALVKLLVKF